MAINDRIQVIHGKYHPSELSYADLQEICDRWRSDGLTIAFTNGCFDVLHEGHMELLKEARARADRLIIALNPDAWIAEHKGVGRPLQTAVIRCAVAHSVASADLTMEFPDETAERLLSIIRPQFYVIGSDYRGVQILGAQYCGEIVIMERLPGVSTTATIQRVHESKSHEPQSKELSDVCNNSGSRSSQHQ